MDSSLAMADAYKLALPAMRAIEELLPQYIHAVEARKKKNESVNEWLAEATACRRCKTPFVRVERPEHPRLVGHFGPVYGIACKRCNASVYPPPELHLMLRAEEFLKAALSLNRPASSEERPTHVVLFLLYHASELYLKCLGTYTYYIGDTPIDLATYETENKEDPDEEPDKLFLSHTLTHGFARIPRPVQHRLVYFAKEQKTNIKKVIETIPEAVNLFCRYPWATPKYEAAIETVPYSEEELVPILCNLCRVLGSFTGKEHRGSA